MIEGDTIILKPGGILVHSREASHTEGIRVTITAISDKMWQGRDSVSRMYVGHLRFVDIVENTFETGNWRQT